MPFREIFQQTDVAACIQPGLQSLGQYSRVIECDAPNRFEDSVNIDDCLKLKHPQENRWDYAFGFNNRIYYVEVHHVSDGHRQIPVAKRLAKPPTQFASLENP